MKLRDAWFLLRMDRLSGRFEEMLWLRAGLRSGALEALTRRSLAPAELARALGGDADLTQAFLTAGCACGWLRDHGGHLALTSRAKTLLSNPGLRALVLYEAETRERGMRILPEVLRGGGRPTLDPEAPPIIARVSALAAPLTLRFLRRLPGLSSPGAKLLDVGCGTAEYLAGLSGRLPNAQALGLDLDPNVVALANENLQRLAMGGRIQVRCADIRTAALDPPYRLILANQILHYFPVQERPALFQRLASLLEPGGHLVVQQLLKPEGRPQRSLAFLDLFLSLHSGMSRLPTASEVGALLSGAGLEAAPPRRVAFSRAFRLFAAQRRS